MDGRGQQGAMAVEFAEGAVTASQLAARVLSVTMRGAIQLEHMRAITRYVDGVIEDGTHHARLFLDLLDVTDYAMDAQLHFSEWAREQAGRIDGLHFALHAESSMLGTLRAIVIALPIRAYLYSDRERLQASVARAIQGA